MSDTPDQHVNRGARSVLARHWIDLTKTTFASRRGILRLVGEIKRMGPDAKKSIDPSNLEKIDTELRRVQGVTRVHYDLSNWRRDDDGHWELLVDPQTNAKATSSENAGGSGTNDAPSGVARRD